MYYPEAYPLLSIKMPARSICAIMSHHLSIFNEKAPLIISRADILNPECKYVNDPSGLLSAEI